MRKALIATLTGLGIILASATAANAGGSGDFYKSNSCSVGTTKGTLTNYDIATGQRYHHGMNYVNGYRPFSVRYDGTYWPFGASSGTISDGYKDYSNPLTSHTITFNWKQDVTGYGKSCSITM